MAVKRPGSLYFSAAAVSPLPRRPGHGFFLAFERVFQLLHGGYPHVEGCSLSFDGAGLGQVVDLLAPFRLEQCGIGFRDHRREAEVFGVVGDDQEIERSRQLDGQAAVRLHLFAACEPIGLLGPDDGASHAGVRRVRRVQVGVAEVDAVRERLRRVRRVVHLPRGRSGAVLRVGLWPGRCHYEKRQRDCSARTGDDALHLIPLDSLTQAAEPRSASSAGPNSVIIEPIHQ